MSIADEIEKLNGLRQSGALSEEEYQKAKETLLSGIQSGAQPPPNAFVKSASDFAADTNNWCMLIHVSQFCGFIVPGAGLVVPIVLWQMKKKESAVIDQNGCIVANWIVTEILAAIVFMLLCFVLIGVPLLIALAIVGIVFPILGAVKASNGEVWKYPCSLEFFKPAAISDPFRDNYKR